MLRTRRAADRVEGPIQARKQWRRAGGGHLLSAFALRDTVAVTRDTTAPTVTIDSVSKTLLNSADSTFTIVWHATENGTFAVKVGGTSCADATQVTGTTASGSYSTQPNTSTSAVNASALAQEANTLRVCVTETAPNTGAATTTVSKDTTAPTGTDVQGQATGSIAQQIDFGDKVVLTFSEATDPASIQTGWNGSSTSVTINVNHGPANNDDTLTSLARISAPSIWMPRVGEVLYHQRWHDGAKGRTDRR
jgi:hypothetical protein